MVYHITTFVTGVMRHLRPQVLRKRADLQFGAEVSRREFTDARVGRQEGDIDVHAEISDLIFLEPIRGIFERAAGELRFDGIADLRRYRATA